MREYYVMTTENGIKIYTGVTTTGDICITWRLEGVIIYRNTFPMSTIKEHSKVYQALLDKGEISDNN